MTPTAIDASVLDDLRRRVDATHFVRGVPGRRWQWGTDHDYLADLVDSWRSFDWRVVEERLLGLPWQQTANGLNLIHQRAQDPDAPAVVLLHGWPDSVLRFEKVLPLLTDVHVVVPALPGYPYSGSAGADQPEMAALLDSAVDELGYRDVVVSGGDIGAQVAEAWARARPARIGALHLTDVPFRHVLVLDVDELTDPELDFKRRMKMWQAAEGAYAAEHATKPNTLSAALGDSPVGLAAWIVEKLRAWSDCDGDVESVFSRDDVLSWITFYWVTETIGTSFTPYAFRPAPDSSRISIPTAVTAFAHEPLVGPRAFAERIVDVRVWDERTAGGHFGAWEQPAAFVDGVRAAVRLATEAVDQPTR